MFRLADVNRHVRTRPLLYRRLAGLACLAALSMYSLAGCNQSAMAQAGWWDIMTFRSQTPDESEETPAQPKKSGTYLEIPYIGDYVTAFGGTGLIPVQGVGLVVGLDKTGEDPPPSFYRSLLVEEMKKRDVENPNRILASPDTAMVIVKAYIPVNCKRGDKFDAEVMLPPNSVSTSLAGGYLLAARLAEQTATGGGQLRSGNTLAVVSGPILVSNSNDQSSAAGNLRRGRILGGATYSSQNDRDLAIYLRNEFRGQRMTVRVAEAIGKRFHGHDKSGLKVPMAEAKDDQRIVLKIPAEYKENYPRYISVIRNIAFREDEIAQRLRMQKLEQQLNLPEESETAALRLEAIGVAAAPILKRALQHKDIEVRFNASMALTYMGYTDGLEALAEAAQQEPAFRVYALAALACCKEAEASAELRELLKDDTSETRYGAFRALTMLNEADPAVAGVKMKGDYSLHALRQGGPPLVHITHHTKAEIVLFGDEQALQLPAALQAGPHIQVVATPGSSEVSVSRYSAGVNKKKVVSPKLTAIIEACDELGATYPDIVALLIQADRQRNLPGKLAIDALPTGGRAYVSKDAKQSQRSIGSEYTTPNLYSPPANDAAKAREVDISEVPAEVVKESNRTKLDSEVRTVSAEEESGGIVTADAQTEAPSQEGAPRQLPPESATTGERPWYDVRRIFKKPEWIGSDPPPQSEPAPK